MVRYYGVLPPKNAMHGLHTSIDVKESIIIRKQKAAAIVDTVATARSVV